MKIQKTSLLSWVVGSFLLGSVGHVGLAKDTQSCVFEKGEVRFERRAWNANVRAHTNAWGIVGISLNQFSEKFSEAGSIQIKNLLDIKTSRHQDIAIFNLAEAIDELVTSPLVKGVPQVADTKAYLRRALSQEERHLVWLADLMDCLYEYKSERPN